MRTTTLRTMGMIFSAGILLTSCVSSKKYHKSQAEVAKLRADSTSLAQQGMTLQQSLSGMTQKNTDLQQSIQAANTANTGLQKNVAYYHDYFEKQKTSATQVNDELKTTLAPSGITDQDLMMTDGKIYVNMAEKSLFKGSSAVLTAKGMEMVNNLGQFVKSHDGLDVSVADLQQANMTGSVNGGTDNTMASSATATTDQDASGSVTGSSSTRATHITARATSNKIKTGNRKDNGYTLDSAMAKRTAVVHHKKKVQPVNGESKAVAYSSGHHSNYTTERNNRSAARAIAWKRQNAVADALLKNGIPKVKLVAQNQPGTENTGSAQKGIQVVLTQDMDKFYKQMSDAPTSQPVGKTQ